MCSGFAAARGLLPREVPESVSFTSLSVPPNGDGAPRYREASSGKFTPLQLLCIRHTLTKIATTQEENFAHPEKANATESGAVYPITEPRQLPSVSKFDRCEDPCKAVKTNNLIIAGTHFKAPLTDDCPVAS